MKERITNYLRLLNEGEEYNIKKALYSSEIDPETASEQEIKRAEMLSGDGGLTGAERVENEREFYKFLNGEEYDKEKVKKHMSLVNHALKYMENNNK